MDKANEVTIYRNGATLRVVRGEHAKHTGAGESRVTVYPSPAIAYAKEEDASVRAAILRIAPDAKSQSVKIGKVRTSEFTDLESRALAALNAESAGNGHDFGVLEYVAWNADRQQLGGLVSALQRKGAVASVDTVKVDGQTLTQYVLAERVRS